MFKSAHLTDTGLKRTNNEDDYLVMKEKNLFVVSDGMGGHEKGEVASKIIVDVFRNIFSKDIFDDDETVPLTDDSIDVIDYRKKDLEKILNDIIIRSTSEIINYAKEQGINVKMGSTIVGVYKFLDRDEMAVFHLGDSRAYRIRGYEITQLTVDHSKYEEMKQSKNYTEEELSKVGRNSITKAVGNFKARELEIKFIDLEKKDIFLLCSDGVSDLCSEEELLNKVLVHKDDLDGCCLSIKNMVYARGAKDNLTLILGQY